MTDIIAPTKKFHKTTYPTLDPTRPELSAKGRTIVVTGGGTGIGAETARYFAKAGALRIALLGRRSQPLLDTKSKIEKEHPTTSVLAIPTDITNSEAVNAAFTQVAEDGKIDVLISCAAALGALGTVIDIPADKWYDGVHTNILGTYNVARAFLLHASANAVLIDVNSAAAHITIAPKFSAYNVSKMATARIYSSLVAEHPEHSFFSIQPGAVDTDMNRASGYKAKKEGEEFEWKGEGVGSLSTHDDASLPASFMVWLASPEARFLSGKYLWANWDVDELMEKKEQLENSLYLTIGLMGWPFTQNGKH